MKKQCKLCGLFRDKEKAEKKPNKKNNWSNGWNYRDPDGGMWLGNLCPDCARSKARAFGRKQGHKTTDEVTEHCNALGRASEKMAKEWFEKKGYRTEITLTGKGPDLIIQRKGKKLRVEVKTAIIRKRKTKTTFKVKAVSPNRITDDLIAYVWRDGHIRVKRMKSHLRKTWKDGDCEVFR